MSNGYFRVLTKHEYQMTRCQDGIILLFPIEGSLEIQHFAKKVTINNDIYVINNKDIFSINKNEKTLMIYIASDWFKEEGFNFFGYKYSINLVKSINAIKKALLQITMNHINHKSVSEDNKYIVDIVQIIGRQGSVEIDIANDQYNYAYYGELSEVLDYINENIEKKLTLKDVSSNLFTSKSNLSSQFTQLLNISFKTYVDTLKIANSFELLLKTDDTISLISEKVGFSSASSYSKTFKSYMGMTPNEYRSCNKYEKIIFMDYETHIDDSLQNIRDIILSQQYYYQKKTEHKIYIDSKLDTFIKPYQCVVQINTSEEIKLLFLEKYIDYLDESPSLMIYVRVDMKEIKEHFTVKELQRIFEYIIRKNLNISFKLEDLNLINFLEMTYENVLDYLEIHQVEVNVNHELGIVFDLEKIDLKAIYRMILKIQHKTNRFSFGLEISNLLNNPVLFKTLESQIKRVNFQFLFIDNSKLNHPYLIEGNNRLLVKNILHYQNMREILNHIDLENQRIIFLNVENHVFLNSEYNDLNSSAPLIVETNIKSAQHFDGIGFNFRQDSHQFNALHLFDEKGFKTILGTMMAHIMTLSQEPKYIKDHYIVIEKENKFILFIYDWRVLESESRNANYEKTDIYVDFKHKTNKNHLIKIQQIDDYNGNINHIITEDIRNRYQWSKTFLKKVNRLLHPSFKIREHNFNKEALQIKLDYNGLYIIEIYK
ncbi:helix-turn-helix transcriptional regulator [Staphylococcus hominis]|uniref:helix-turn-helix transcriptional regulator n=1 Tax=Staphylococcus hominis TaxID=1290 RepID=UPI000D1E5F74|nr:helix-turn-helix transcriptional regulator [Staphylococcus hominis]MCE4975491.1 helix-turn-helix transcriptional regulator [Staphylococcus hominis]PTK22685.1 AraC family transcriptional regulator [Staphylococcus hominis]PTK36445.1 AraC family transcriptional regulator [Staphylococcus hominis]PTK42857.1 AraC family transcriptional regulator [Staphylococcus hominis]RIO52390.1 AraC family transcriptional regulator [Staphylococcus hominis]